MNEKLTRILIHLDYDEHDFINYIIDSLSDHAEYEPTIVNIRGPFYSTPKFCAETVWVHHDGDIPEQVGFGNTLLEALVDLYENSYPNL